MSSLRSPGWKVMSGIPSVATKASTAARKSLLIGSITTAEAKGCPRCSRKKWTTPPRSLAKVARPTGRREPTPVTPLREWF
jgi:hypothetical protein